MAGICFENNCKHTLAIKCSYRLCGKCCYDPSCTAHKKRSKKKKSSDTIKCRGGECYFHAPPGCRHKLCDHCCFDYVECDAHQGGLWGSKMESILSFQHSALEDAGEARNHQIQEEFKNFQRQREDEIFEKTLEKLKDMVV